LLNQLCSAKPPEEFAGRVHRRQVFPAKSSGAATGCWRLLTGSTGGLCSDKLRSSCDPARMGYIVTDLVKQQVRKLFAPDEAELVISALATSHLPHIADGEAPERIHLAVLHLSGGNLQKFDEAFRGGMIDWRDTLVGAGLGDADWPDVLRGRGIDFRGTYDGIVKAGMRRMAKAAKKPE